MTTLKNVLKMAGVAMCLGIAAPVFAQAAPVYDADTMQDEGNSQDQAQYLPPPPPPGQEGNTFIPVQSTVASAPSSPPANAEQQASNVQNGESAARVDTLQSEVQALRGQVETLTHRLEQLQNQQKTMYTDLDGRIKQPSANAAPAAAPVPTAAANLPAADDNAVVADKSADDMPVAAPAVPKHAAKPILIKTSKKQTTSSDMKKGGQPNIAEEQQIYQTAYNLIKVKRYNDAVTALQGMLKKYPSGQFASNAHYWLGELYGIMSKNDLALNEFQTVVDVYPESPRVSDAQLKVGLLLASQLRWPEAKSALKTVVSNYPGSASAKMASEQLKQIKVAGH